MKLFFNADQDLALLPFFLEHYRKLGVTQFFCSTLYNKVKPQKDLCVYPYGVDTTLDIYSQMAEAIRGMIRRHVFESEWYILADLDEFHEYPLELPDLIHRCEQRGKDCVLGEMVDRVKEDGSIPELTNEPLEIQFPVKSVITRDVMLACVQKIMLCRGIRNIDNGHHSMQEVSYPYPSRGVIHHFKWHSGIVSRMKERLAQPHKDLPWYAEAQRFINHWQLCGSVNVQSAVY